MEVGEHFQRVGIPLCWCICRFKKTAGVIIVLLCLGVLTGYLYGYHKTTTSSDSSPCPAAADVIQVGTILESNSPNTKPLPPHTDFQISHLYDHDEFELAVNTTVPSYHEKVYNTDWRFYADIDKCAIARFNKSFSGMKHASCWYDYFPVNIEDFFEQWPLEESFLKKKLGSLYRSSQSELIGRVYLFLADKVVKAEYQLHTENDSSSMDVSVSGTESQVGENRNVSSKMKSNFEKPITVDYKSKQLCVKAHNGTHYTFTLDCTHEDSTWVIVENGKIQFTEKRLKEGSTWVIIICLFTGLLLVLVLLYWYFCYCYPESLITPACRNPPFEEHAERILNSFPTPHGTKFTQCPNLPFAEQLALGAVIKMSEQSYSLTHSRLTATNQKMENNESVGLGRVLSQVFKLVFPTWCFPQYYEERLVVEKGTNLELNKEAQEILERNNKTELLSLYVATDVLYGRNCSLKMSKKTDLKRTESCPKIAIGFQPRLFISDKL